MVKYFYLNEEENHLSTNEIFKTVIEYFIKKIWQ